MLQVTWLCNDFDLGAIGYQLELVHADGIVGERALPAFVISKSGGLRQSHQPLCFAINLGQELRYILLQLGNLIVVSMNTLDLQLQLGRKAGGRS